MDILSLIMISLCFGMLMGIIFSIHRYVEFGVLTFFALILVITVSMGSSVMGESWPWWYFLIGVLCVWLGEKSGRAMYKEAFEKRG